MMECLSLYHQSLCGHGLLPVLLDKEFEIQISCEPVFVIALSANLQLQDLTHHLKLHHCLLIQSSLKISLILVLSLLEYLVVKQVTILLDVLHWIILYVLSTILFLFLTQMFQEFSTLPSSIHNLTAFLVFSMSFVDI